MMKASMTDLDEIALPSDWAARSNPNASTARRASMDLLDQLGIVPAGSPQMRAFDELRLHELTSYVYPSATRDRLCLCNDMMSYFFLIDDDADANEARGKRPRELWRRVSLHMLALRFGECTDHRDPLTRLMLDIHRRLKFFADRMWMSRFATDMRNYLLEGTVAAAFNWAQGVVPDVDVYLVQRDHDVAGYPAQDLIEVAERAALPERVQNDPLFREMRSICTRVVAYTNDLVSYETERAVDNPNNLVDVLCVHRGFTVARARAEIIRTINDNLRRYRLLESQYHPPEEHLEPVSRYRAGQKGLMRGNLLWSLRTRRYQRGPEPEIQQSAGWA